MSPFSFRNLLLIATATAGLALPASVATGSPATESRAGGDFFVPTGHRTGFGAFREGADSPDRLRRAFGLPAREGTSEYGGCVLGWPEIGVVAELASFGDTVDACEEGTFVEARLNDSRWHTATGVRIGSRASKVRRAALRRCTRRTCSVSGYALELHHTDCASVLSAGVIAHVSGGRVASLIVRWRSCE